MDLKYYLIPRRFPTGAVLITALLLLSGTTLGEINLSPLFHYISNDDELYGQALGPLFEFSLPTCPREDRLAAVPRPFHVRFRQHSGRVEGWDSFWPLAASRTRGDGHYTYVLNFLHTRKPEDFSRQRQRWWLLPVFFAGRDDQGDPYYAIFPVGGSIANAGLAERVTFILFPLYLKTEKGELIQHSLLWPVFSSGKSEAIRKWRIFPIYGVNHRDQAVQRFILWPFLHLGRTETENFRANAFFLFPLYGDIRQHSPDDELLARSQTVLWPFFKYESSPIHEKLHLPWPFLQFEQSQDPINPGDKKYLWPLYGHRSRPNSDYRFLLWPLLHHRVVAEARYETRMHWLAPIWQKTERIERESEEQKYVSRRLWPIFRQRKTEKEHEIYLLNLWPTPTTPVIERNYAPLWQIYSYKETPDTETHTLFWGLWRHTQTESKHQHRLFPLFEYKNIYDNENSLSLLSGILTFTRRPEGKIKTRLLWFFKL